MNKKIVIEGWIAKDDDSNEGVYFYDAKPIGKGYFQCSEISYLAINFSDMPTDFSKVINKGECKKVKITIEVVE